jgi:hypothetical protein
MRSLGDLLKSHRVPGVRQAEIRTTCAKLAEALTGYPVKPKQVRYKEGTLFFSVPSVVKSELALREEEIKKTLAAAGISVSAVK